MAIGINADTAYAQRGSIPSGGAGTLSDGGFTNCFAGVWLYRPSVGNSYALTSEGSIIHFQAGAREIKLGFDNTFGAGGAADPLLQIIFNSGGDGTLPVQTFVGGNILDEWVYYFILDNATDGQIVGYIKYSDLDTAYTITRTNNNATSQYINAITFGNHSTGGSCVLGRYAYARARYATGMTLANVLAYARSSSAASMWGFWTLDDNTDTGDDSGNSRPLTFNGTISSETSLVLEEGPPGATTTYMQPYSRKRSTLGFRTIPQI